MNSTNILISLCPVSDVIDNLRSAHMYGPEITRFYHHLIGTNVRTSIFMIIAELIQRWRGNIASLSRWYHLTLCSWLSTAQLSHTNRETATITRRTFITSSLPPTHSSLRQCHSSTRDSHSFLPPLSSSSCAKYFQLSFFSPPTLSLGVVYRVVLSGISPCYCFFFQMKNFICINFIVACRRRLGSHFYSAVNVVWQLNIFFLCVYM